MSKKWGVVLSVLLLLSYEAYAQKKRPLLQQADEGVSGQGYGMAGCGLGSILLGTSPGIVQIFAATTNGTSANQTFGITTGTSNCKPAGGTGSAALFMTVNKEALAKDVSRGSGETLAGFSELVGCKNSNLLGGKLQKNYESIFPIRAFDAVKSTKKVLEMIRSDHELVTSCKEIS